MFWKKKQEPQQQVTSGRFEIERNGEVAFLDYTIAGNVLALLHTEVPRALRRLGLASELAQTALDWAQENGKKVDIVCPTVADYVDKRPEYAHLVLR